MTDNFVRATMQVDVLWAARDSLTRRSATDHYPHVAAINGTVFDPPMSIEAVSASGETGGVVHPQPDNIEFGIDITVWPKGGWMIGLNIATGQNNLVEIVWLP